MTIVEMYNLCKSIYEANKDAYEYIGLRFEDKVRAIGDICECSRHNPDRNDERDFPSFGSEDYEDMPLLDGTSAWNMALSTTYRIQSWEDKTDDCRNHFLTTHCYVIAGDRKSTHEDADDGEIVIRDAVVIAQIF